MRFIRSLPWAKITVVLIGLILALVLRVSLLEYKSSDYFTYTKVWYLAIKAGGFSAFGQAFSNYNLPYLYLLYLVIRFFPNLPPEMAVKIPSLVADLVSAWFVYRLVQIKYSGSALSLFGGLVTLFAPTVVLNSAFWGQADALYTSALLGSVYYFIRRRPALAMLAFGVAFAFKAQAMFLAPVIFALFLRREIPWKYIILPPLVFLLSLIPAWLAGRPLLDLLLIYPLQAEQYQMLSMHAPSLYALLPDSSRTFRYFFPAGLMIAVAAALCLVVLMLRSRAKLTPALVVQLALASVLLLPFLLPKMHERYFYPADVMSIVFAAFFPAYYYVAIAMSAISFLAYQPYLFGADLVPMPLLALGVLILLSVVGWRTVRELFADEPVLPQPDLPPTPAA